MGQHINTFIGGMDKDTSKHKYSNSKYIDANNVRPLTSDGLSSGALENVSGTKFVIDFTEILSMSIIDITNADNEEDSIKTINDFFIDTGYPQTSIVAFNITFTTSTELLSKIKALIEEKNSTLPLQLQYKIGILDSIDRIAVYNFATPIQSISADIYHTPQIYPITRDFIVIGSTELRDDIILFTENQTGPRNFGQIWKFSYDVARPENPAYYSLVLLYNGAIDLSVEHPVEAKARYENEKVQRVYWTDNKNVIRGANLADPNLFAFRAQEFSLNPETVLSPAILSKKDMSNGNLSSGIWYVTYKISRINGGVTPAAPFSAGIPVIVDDPSVGVGGGDTDYHTTNYAITSVPTTKSINFKIFNFPKGYDQITIYAVHEADPGNFTAYLYENTFIADIIDFEFTISDVSLKEVIPLSSLTDDSVDFDRVKTITIKDNSLLVGNVSVSGFDIELDTRAYRFTNSQGKKTYVGAGGNFSLTSDQEADPNWLIGEKEDVINPYNNDSTLEALIASGRSEASLDYSYQIDGKTKGGTGPNVSYEFVSTQFLLDNSSKSEPIAEVTQTLGVSPSTARDTEYNSNAPFVNVPATDNIDVNINGENVDIGPGFPNFKNPSFEANFTGYMRDEVYRFGIVFYSKTGKASEVKWIGDIRFPSAGDGEQLPSGFVPLSLAQYTNGIIRNSAPFGGLASGSSGGKVPAKEGGGTYGHSIGIKFNVDVSSIKDNISGYSIVRSPRREKDRTIIAEGVMHTVELRQRPMLTSQFVGGLLAGAPYFGEKVGIDGFEFDIKNKDGWKHPQGSPGFTERVLKAGKWKGVEIDQGDLYIKDEIKNSSERFDGYAPDLATTFGFNYANSNTKTDWRFGTIDCPDLKMITGAKLNGFENREENSLSTENDYRIKPVSLYSAQRESKDGILQTTTIDVTGRIRDRAQFKSISQSTFAKADSAEDIYSKSTALIDSTSMWNRYLCARTFGSLKDVFFVDHGNGADAYTEIKDYNGTDRKFRNAGIREIVGSTSVSGISRTQNLTFGGIGTRTILFQAHDWLFSKRIINAAGGLSPTNQRDPYFPQDAAGSTPFTSNNLHVWGYKGGTSQRHRGMYAVVDITRILKSQYGGDSYFERQESEYITTNNFVNATISSSNILSSNNVYGGDITTTLWTEKKFYTYNESQATIWTGDASGPYRLPDGSIRGIIIPMQTIANTELRPLIHLNNYNSDTISIPDIITHRGNPDEYAIPVLFHKENTLQRYFVSGAGVNFVSEYDNRVYMSNTKTNGELIDNWAVFEALKYKDVNGEYGPINKLETFNDNVVFFQDKAFGTLAVNPRSVIQDAGGNDLTFGVGGGIVDFNYISNSIGSTHQWGIQRTHKGIYFFDSLHKKMYVFAGQASPISDLKGMSSWFYNKILGDAISKDNPILFQGIHTAYDQRFNEVIFTFHFYTDVLDTTVPISIEDLLAGIDTTDNTNNNNNTAEVTIGVNENIANIINTNNNNTNNNNTITTFPETSTTIYYTSEYLMNTLGLYKVSMSDALLALVQAELATGSKLLMTLPTNNPLVYTYVEVNINEIETSNYPGFAYVESSEMLPWATALSNDIKELPIAFKCVKDTLDINDNFEEQVNTKPISDITSVTVSDSIITSEVDANPRPNERISYTIVYNELTQAFTSFYSHWPRHYFSNGRRIFSQDPGASKIYVHDEGNRGQFYGTLYPSNLQLMIAPPGNHTKVFNNIEFNSQVYDSSGSNLTDITLDKARFFNEYQDSQIIDFIPNINIKRRMRTWRLQIPRDTDSRNSRMRNAYINTIFSFENTANRRIVLHDTTTHYMDTPM